MSAVQETQTIESDGLLIDTVTGEIVGIVEGNRLITHAISVMDEEEIRLIRARLTRRSIRLSMANNALTEAENAMKLIEEEALFKARQTEDYRFQERIAQNARQIADKAKAEHDGIFNRFKLAITEALPKLLIGKSRTWECEFGRFGLKQKPARQAVTDEKKFIDTAIRHGKLDWLKIEPRISAVPKDLSDEDRTRFGITLIPAEDELTESA